MGYDVDEQRAHFIEIKVVLSRDTTRSWRAFM